ncbi:hypothetical protein EDEG_03641 [Edhazardia aedis USNM 41457]|uniref:Uncharacterized protein n=1 Tax=Edhazardia aedis (strain USNM 41457) TaxID=1003232 RepID=J9DKH1_EDHAE|nr:hypothetical protein EDEG_03641 [Edhazardia aedis USNM 41457]|eukprot:EJW01887.1 hypothetical protein EDEG_03641 [Edhazardia aedis USNM 41457]
MSDDEYSEETLEAIQSFIDLVKKVEKVKKDRKEILERHFPELFETKPEAKKDLEIRISEIINKNISHPPVFLASILGFSKSNWNKTVEKMLIDLGLTSRLRYCSYENMQRYEKLKHLILKYIDKKYKTK